MRTILIFVVIATFYLQSCMPQKLGFTKTLKNPKLTKLWETDTVLNDLESVIYDKTNNILYVTCINGHWLKPNGKGFISKIDLNGEIISHKWIDKIEGPTGMTIYKNKLFVADFDTVLEIDLITSRIIKKYKIEGTERINDLTVSEDGTVYGSGTKSGKLFALKKGKAIILKNNLEWPNGVLYEDKNILIGLGDKTISSYNLKTKTSKIIAKNIFNPDGIVAIGNGDYLISSWEGMIHYVTKNGTKILLLNTTKEKVNAADITYIPELKMILVPAMLKHKLIAYKLTDEN
ncbi:hypothetical protein [Tenacibaculum sp. E3R01]|uniref:hypothetical protein n=1 Tax=Tenacibaculum sp. E3R01 TaxID=2267227 RepID=UPI0011BED592|nr:hypothetical protein [Tenacibaculum sp. E3R01]